MRTGKPIILKTGNYEYYSGAYEIEPVSSSQMIQTHRMIMSSNITIKSFNSNAETDLFTALIQGDISSMISYDGEISIIRPYLFSNNRQLISASFKKAKEIGGYAFYECMELTSIYCPEVLSIGRCAFLWCTKLPKIDFPEVLSVGYEAFTYCYELSKVNLPKATCISEGAFIICSALEEVYLPKATTIGDSAFYNCSKISQISMPEVAVIRSGAFLGCSLMMSVYLPGNNVCSIGSTNVFGRTPISVSVNGQYGSVFVPASLISEYKNTKNWSVYSARIAAIEE